MNIAVDKIIKKVRIFLKDISWKKILTFSFFVVIAAFLWFMQIYNKTYETNIVIPIKYTSVPDSIIFSDSLPKELRVRVKDYGYAMFRYHFNRDDTLYMDISPIMNGSGGPSSKILQGTALEAYINNYLPQTAQLLRYDPIRITFSYSLLKNRKIPVIFDGQINLSPGYFLNGDIRISPDSVMAYGSTADLTKLTYAYTVSDTINGLESNRKIFLDLVNVNNVKFIPGNVSIYVPVEAYRQMRVDVPVECLNLPENLNVKFFPSRVSLSFFIGVSQADLVHASDFSVGVDYDGIKDSKSAAVPVRITSSPSYARSLTIEPPDVEYIFEYK